MKTLIGFFDKDTAEEAIAFGGRPDCIVASSIFTHLEDPKAFANLCSDILAPNGVLIIEVEYLPIILEDYQFERFYFDRPYYYSAKSLEKFSAPVAWKSKTLASYRPTVDPSELQ